MQGGPPMRTTINLPDDLLQEAMGLSAEKTKTAVIIAALHAYVREQRVEQIIAKRGRLEFLDTWDKGRHER